MKLLLSCFLALGLASAAQAAPIFSGSVDARSAIYGDGLLPRSPGSLGPVEVDVTGATALQFAASGLTNCCATTPGSTADGVGPGTASGRTSVTSLNGISGITVEGRQMFLAGVFVDTANLPTSGSEPASLTYSVADLNDPSFAPLLNQAFFIGDGVDNAAASQTFTVATGANKLLLGFVDSFNFLGAPSYYEDNTGSLSVTVTDVSDVPLPAGAPLLLAGLGGLVWMRRRKS